MYSPNRKPHSRFINYQCINLLTVGWLTADGLRWLYDGDATDTMVGGQVRKSLLAWHFCRARNFKIFNIRGPPNLKADDTRLTWHDDAQEFMSVHHRANVVFLWKGCIIGMEQVCKILGALFSQNIRSANFKWTKSSLCYRTKYAWFEGWKSGI